MGVDLSKYDFITRILFAVAVPMLVIGGVRTSILYSKWENQLYSNTDTLFNKAETHVVNAIKKI